MTLILDAGAFVAIERGDRKVLARLRSERLAGRQPLTHGGVIGQVWRGGSRRQAILARALPMVQVVPLGEALGRRAGELLAVAGTTDVIDAALVLLAGNGDLVLTSDPGHIRILAEVARRGVDIVPV